MKKYTFLILIAALSKICFAQVKNYQDWAVACDNTQHCEAVGFQKDNSDSKPVAWFIARDAGANSKILSYITTQEDSDSEHLELRATIGNKTLSGFFAEKNMEQKTFRDLLKNAKKAQSLVIKIVDTDDSQTLSLLGMKDALLEMDKEQGRIGTPSALIAQGNKPESSVFLALPVPIVYYIKIKPTDKKDDVLHSNLLKMLKDNECMADSEHETPFESNLYRLNNHQVLLVKECSRGAYQSSYGLWVANDKAPYKIHKANLPDSDGDVISADVNDTDGLLSSSAKWRGIGDCWSTLSWAWTGESFDLVSESNASACRGFAGGIPLRLWITEPQVSK